MYQSIYVIVPRLRCIWVCFYKLPVLGFSPCQPCCTHLATRRESVSISLRVVCMRSTRSWWSPRMFWAAQLHPTSIFRRSTGSNWVGPSPKSIFFGLEPRSPRSCITVHCEPSVTPSGSTRPRSRATIKTRSSYISIPFCNSSASHRFKFHTIDNVWAF